MAKRCTKLERLPGGLRNASYRLGDTVLRIYKRDKSICQREVDLLRRIANAVPVPEVIYAEPNGWKGVPPFALLRYVEGITYRELARSGDSEAIAQAAFSVGEALAAIRTVSFPAPEPPKEIAWSKLERRVPVDLVDRLRAFVDSWSIRISESDQEPCLVHGDFGKANVIVNRVSGRWRVAAVLDWELATSGHPLLDIGHFLRYERSGRPSAEPHLSEGYMQAGGKLPPDWRALARAIDLTRLCEDLTHDDLPDWVAQELTELARATIECRDACLA